MPRLSENAIKFQLILPFSIMLAICLFIFIYGYSKEEQSHITEDFLHNTSTINLNYNSALKTEIKTLSTALEFLKNDTTLKHQLRSHNREKAIQYISPIFHRLKSEFLITHFYLLSAERQVIARAHKPDRYGDQVNRFTALEAEKTGQPAAGIELGTLGTFTLRVVYPVYDDKQLIGYIELGEEIKHVLDNIINTSDIELSIVINKEFLSYEDWKQGAKILGHNPDWNLSASYAETFSSSKVPPDILNQALNNSQYKNNVTQHKINNKHFFSTALPLIDAGKQKIGKLIIIRDMTKRLKTNQQTITRMTTLSIITGVLILLFMYFLADKIEHKLETARMHLIKESKQRETMHKNHIAELKNNQMQLLRAQDEITNAMNRAERANRAKSEFLSCMSHELRTPLNIILGYADILEYETDTDSTTYKQSINHIQTSGQQLLSLVNDLLDFSTNEIHKLKLDIYPLNIHDIITCCTSQIEKAMASQKNIKIETRISSKELMVLGDDLRLRQVLINLLSNAVKYNRDNGSITLSSEPGNNGKLKIKIQDTGIGIPEDKQSLLFTPFERIDQKHGAISGTGIGLYIAKQLVEAMHGNVGMESSENKGSTFWFDLPLAENT